MLVGKEFQCPIMCLVQVAFAFTGGNTLPRSFCRLDNVIGKISIEVCLGAWACARTCAESCEVAIPPRA